MKILKRDGSIADFNRDNIYKAILKAMKYGSGIYNKELADAISKEIAEDCKLVDEKTGEPYTAHTVGKVQAVLYNAPNIKALKNGRLADISPTLLDLLNIEKPQEMSGQSLLEK